MKNLIVSHQQKVALLALAILQFIFIAPVVYNRLSVHGDIYLDIAFAYDIKNKFETFNFFEFLWYFIFEASDHKAQPLSHLIFPFLYLTSDPWILQDVLAIALNITLIGSLFYVFNKASGRIVLPMLCSFCLVNRVNPTFALASVELILVFSCMFWLAAARLYATTDYQKIDPVLIFASFIAFAARPLESLVVLLILFISFYKSHVFFKNKNLQAIAALSALWWLPRLMVLWRHGKHLPIIEDLSLSFSIPQIILFLFGAMNLLFLVNAKKTIRSQSTAIGIAVAVCIFSFYFAMRLIIDDYAVFPILLLSASICLFICNSPYKIINSICMCLLILMILDTYDSFSNRPRRPQEFKLGEQLATRFEQKSVKKVTLIYSERLLESLKKRTGSHMVHAQLIHLYLQNSVNGHGSYAEISWPYPPHILWWLPKADPLEPQDFLCSNLQEDESKHYIIIDTPHGEGDASPTGRYYDKYKEIKNMAGLFKKAEHVSTTKIFNDMPFATYAGELDCPKIK